MDRHINPHRESLLVPNLDILKTILGYMNYREKILYIHEIIKTQGYVTKSFYSMIEELPLFLDYFNKDVDNLIKQLRNQGINLKYLNLVNSEYFTDDDLKLLTSKPNLDLTLLNLSNNNKITDKGLLLLTNLTKLTYLDLSIIDPYTVKRSFSINTTLLLKSKLKQIRINTYMNYPYEM